MDKSFLLHVNVISVYLLIFAVCNVSYACLGFDGQGYTHPTGDIFIEYNTSTPLEITCVITNKTLIAENPSISSVLYFQKDNNYVPSDKITRLNETSIKLIDENPEKMNSIYSCTLNGNSICVNKVAVDTKPQPVVDFKCIGYNFQNLTCSWTPPPNNIPTNYSLSYTFPKARPGRQKNDRFQTANSANPKTRAQSRPTDCNVTDDKDSKKKCFWSLITKPHYRQVAEQYNFTLKSENRFGTIEQIFLFDHYRNVLSGPPENLSCISSTTSSLFLSWKVPSTIVPFPTGLQHRILYQCKFGPKIMQIGGLIETSYRSDVTYNLTGLKHAHEVCDIRVSIRVKGADTEEMWSSNSSVNCLTSSTIPGAPPRVNIGSFQTDIISNVRDIYIYWQQIPIEIRNAENFQYLVTVNDKNFDYNKLVEQTNSYAKFSNMARDTRYKFTIRSKNSEGLSKDSVMLEVPSNDEIISEPLSFTKVAFDNGLYKLSWERPKRGAEYIKNYTLFWCSNHKDRPYQCTGYLNWTEVPANITEYNITLSNNSTTQFAISANNETSSSGMIWAKCTVMHNKRIKKINEVWISNVDSTSIELSWKLDCEDRSDNVAGYSIYYCQIIKGVACGKLKVITIENPLATYARVTGLTPYTSYRLTVSVTHKDQSTSQPSDELYNTTFESFPSEPYDLRATDITNSSITVAWEPPKKMNGYLRFYDIHFNNSKINANNKTSFTLTNLQSDTVYNISVSAWTSFSSNRSELIFVKTKPEYPEKVPEAWYKRENNSLILRWEKPANKKAPHLYEIKLMYKPNLENGSISLINTTENKYKLPCDQDNKYFTYSSYIRAINKYNNTNYIGPWSEEYKGSCEHTGHDSSLIWIIIVISCLFLICMMLFSGKKLYIYFNDMKTIDVKMPPGLDPQIVDTNWPQPKPDLSLSDEEQLLHKPSSQFNYPCGGESSGCSSGQESVMSDSGSSIASSTSDSGTEHPRVPTDEDPKTRPMDDNALKLIESQPYVQFPERITPWNMNSINSNGYSMYGISDSNNSEIELMNIPKNNVESSPYTTCDQIMKPIEQPRSVSNTYVPLSNTQDKNPPYVMAANKNAIMSNLFYPNVIPNVDERAYVQVADVNGVLKGNTETAEPPQVPSQDHVMHSSNGYISYGDATKATPEVNTTTSSYIPHRPFDISALKND